MAVKRWIAILPLTLTLLLLPEKRLANWQQKQRNRGEEGRRTGGRARKREEGAGRREDGGRRQGGRTEGGRRRVTGD